MINRLHWEMVERTKRAFMADLAAAFTALLLFVWLALEVRRGATIGFDLEVRSAVHAWASGGLTWVMLAITQLGSSLFLVAAGGLIVWRLILAGRRRAAVLLIVACLGAEVLDQALKLLVHRPRPDAFFGLSDPLTYSFPSGHATTACCFYGILAAIVGARLRAPAARIAVWAMAAVMAVAIGLSRIYLGVHYPSDVLGGYVAAVMWLYLLRAGYHPGFPF
jgi:undecaprenyl-diphosphatase